MNRQPLSWLILVPEHCKEQGKNTIYNDEGLWAQNPFVVVNRSLMEGSTQSVLRKLKSQDQIPLELHFSSINVKAGEIYSN